MSGLISQGKPSGRVALIWGLLAVAIVVPTALAAASPLLAYRRPVYMVAGFAGIIAMALLLVQPLLILGYLPGAEAYRGRRLHRWIGASLVAAIVIHVGALWLTSAPDVVDALTFSSPTPFSDWGVIGMWAVFAAALLAVFRTRMRLRSWRIAHAALAVVTVVCSVAHAMLIDGTMETISKAALCVLVVATTVKVVAGLRVLGRGKAAGLRD